MDKLINAILDGIANGAIAQGLIVILVFSLYAVLLLTGKGVPAELTQWGGLILGFYFGANSSALLARVVKAQGK